MSDLVWAIKNGEIDQVREIIESKKETIKDFNVNTEINGRFPLHYAADYGQNEVLAYLIQMGADVDAKDKHGITPMLAAIWEGHTECVRTLINNGAQKEGTTPDGTKNYIDSAEKIEIKELLK